MLSESIAENRKNPEKIIKSFNERIESIKRPAPREEGQKLIDDVNETHRFLDRPEVTNADPKSVQVLRNLIEKTGKSSKEADEMVRSCQFAQWPKYAMTLLVNRKYEGGTKHE